MENLLLLSAVTLGIIVLIGFLNEKFFHLNYEISLMLFSVLIGVFLTVSVSIIRKESVNELLQKVQVYDLEAFLMKGVLCFMLFAGSCHLTISQFRKNARPIGVLAFVCTLLGAVFYGLLFFAVASLLHLPFTLPVCLMFGSIIAPTDPIAATSILKKFGLPKQTGFLMEGESLLNDGVGVALFAVFSGIVTAQKSGGFLEIMLREILGAVLVGVAVTWLSFQLFKNTGDKHRRIIITLFAVSASFSICEILHCSGAIACVVCGVVFSTLREKEEQKGRNWELGELDTFWETLDVLLNSALYVILGLSFVRILQMPHVLGLALAAVVCNLAARAASLWTGSWLIGPIPDGYRRSGFVALFTWGGLRGGLSLALAVSTASIIPEETYVIILGCTYAIVFFTTVVQGLTMKKVFQSISEKTISARE